MSGWITEMMSPDMQAMTADQRLANGCCPECGQLLESLDPLGERDRHWAALPLDRPENQEARHRYQLLTDLGEQQLQQKVLAKAKEAEAQKASPHEPPHAASPEHAQQTKK